MKRFRRLTIAVVAAIVVVTLFLLDRCFFRVPLMGSENASITERLSQPRFDRAAWKRGEDANNPVRIKMVDDLLHRYKLIGRTRSEIGGLLGVPPKTDYFRDYDYVYWLGPERGFMSIDSEWLAIKFDNDRVIEAKVVRD